MKNVLESQLDTDLREKALVAAKRHKTSWVQLGQYLHAIYKEKLYRRWKYQSFEGYCLNELHIKQTTAVKLLKSYRFLENEEPQLARVSQEDAGELTQTALPNYESVNLLRLAMENKKLEPHDIAEVRESVLEMAREPKEVKAQVKRILEEKNPKSPDEQSEMKRVSTIKRAISFLTSMKTQFEEEKTLPKYLINQINDLVSKLEDQLE